MRALQIVIGVLLLIPGACGAIVATLSERASLGTTFLPFTLPGLVLGVVGILLIMNAAGRDT